MTAPAGAPQPVLQRTGDGVVCSEQMSRQVATQSPQQPEAASPTTGWLLQRKCACGNHAVSAGECEGCSKKKRSAQRALRSARGTGFDGEQAPVVIDEVLRSRGQPLDAATCAFMERRFGHDFSHVRVHADERAAESARAIDAVAYTVGHNVVFDAGEYSPHSIAGRQLIAHELTHVIQQANGVVPGRPVAGRMSISDPGDALEREAADAASGLVRFRFTRFCCSALQDVTAVGSESHDSTSASPRPAYAVHLARPRDRRRPAERLGRPNASVGVSDGVARSVARRDGRPS